MLFLAVLLPLIGAGVIPMCKPRNLRGACITVLGLATILMAGCILVPFDVTMDILLPFDVVFSLAIDELGLFFATVFTIVWWLVLLESFTFFKAPEPIFYVYYLGIYGGLMGACASANLITLYFFFELVGLLCFPLIAYDKEDKNINASKKYLLYSMAGAFLGLVGVFYFESLEISRTFTPGGIVGLAQAADKHEILGFFSLAVVGFGCKAGLFPLHAWLKVADPSAPDPAAAVLSGITTKLGVLMILRLSLYVVGADILRDSFAQDFGIALGLITIFVGSILAFRERQLKTRLAYSTISQVAYIIFALFVLQEYALVGGLVHFASHAIAKPLLFLCAGRLTYQTGQTQVEVLQIYPFNRTYLLFLVGSLSLIGIPLTGGFVGKWYMGMGAMSGDGAAIFGAGMLILSALFTARYLLPLAVHPLFTDAPPSWAIEPPSDPNDKRRTEGVYTPIFALMLVALGVYPRPLLEFLFGLAEQLL